MIKFIDLFAGMGGIRCGFEQAAKSLDIPTKCVFTSEIKPHACSILQQNYPGDIITGDITQVSTKDIPDFDILLAGFPCQAFSAAGKRMGFADTRGTLFFDVERILQDKRPRGFLLENVEGLYNHDKGNTLRVIIGNLKALGYKVNYAILNSADFGIPQERRRIYIVGSLLHAPSLIDFQHKSCRLSDILETGHPTSNSPFIEALLSRYSVQELYGKSIKDKRGGDSNIHSWDLELKGSLSQDQKSLMNRMLKERRKKKWAEEIGIEWMDGMPLTTQQISTFFSHEHLQEMLDDLEKKGYVKYEHPKQKVIVRHDNGTVSSSRVIDESRPKGYNIVAGKLSFEISKILHPQQLAPTLVAMDMQKLYVVDGKGLRRLTLREGLRLFGYPEHYQFSLPEKQAFDLLGNTVVVPVIKQVAHRLLQNI